MIAIGNGTASRESEMFVADMIKEASRPVHYVIVSEAGASVYSASKLATEGISRHKCINKRGNINSKKTTRPTSRISKNRPKGNWSRAIST